MCALTELPSQTANIVHPTSSIDLPEVSQEEVKDFEVFAGDTPEEPELVAIDGSFKRKFPPKK